MSIFPAFTLFCAEFTVLLTLGTTHAMLKRFINKTKKILSNRKKKSLYPRLHLGCGPITIKNWTNIDALKIPGVDRIDDIRTLKTVPDNFAEEIYACHVLEHFAHAEIPSILQRWYQILKPGGVLRISVPDLDKIVSIYHGHWQHFQTKGHTPWIGLIYGGQNDQYDFHKTGFNLNWLTVLLENQGFKNIQEYPNEPHFIEGIEDASIDKKTFNEYISLNVMATK